MHIKIENNSSALNHIFKVCLIVFWSCLLASCITKNSDTADSTYFSSQEEADNRLTAFDKENPNCQLWTNWQKMCSRTGPNGETYCVTDPDKPVRPSEPFCTHSPRENYSEYHVSTWQENQKKSLRRFCQEPDRNEERREDQDATGYCKYEDDRPFNDRSLAARRHPWCQEWSDTHGNSPICQEDELSATSCRVMSQQKTRSIGALYCSKTAEIPKFCSAAIGFGFASQVPDADGIIMAIGRKENAVPVNGVFCIEGGK